MPPSKSGSIVGTVVDRRTGLALEGIAAQLKDAINATTIGELVTDQAGRFTTQDLLPSWHWDTKIRYADPQGAYTPEYFGAGPDDFSLGAVESGVDKTQVTVAQTLARETPAQRVDNLIEDVQASLPSGDDAASLVTSLERTGTVLEDANPNNDKGACGLLTGFAGKFPVREPGDHRPEEPTRLGQQRSGNWRELLMPRRLDPLPRRGGEGGARASLFVNANSRPSPPCSR